MPARPKNTGIWGMSRIIIIKLYLNVTIKASRHWHQNIPEPPISCIHNSNIIIFKLHKMKIKE